MKKEQLLALGIDEEAAKKVMDINGEDIESAKRPLSEKIVALESERDGFLGQLETANEALKSFEGINPADIQEKLVTAQTALQQAEERHKSEIAARDSRAETEKFLVGKKFINEITKNHFVNQIEDSLAAPENKGKNRQDLFDMLTHTADGKPNEGIFVTENPNNILDLPPSGNTDPLIGDEFQKKIDKYRRN